MFVPSQKRFSQEKLQKSMNNEFIRRARCLHRTSQLVFRDLGNMGGRWDVRFCQIVKHCHYPLVVGPTLQLLNRTIDKPSYDKKTSRNIATEKMPHCRMTPPDCTVPESHTFPKLQLDIAQYTLISASTFPSSVE